MCILLSCVSALPSQGIPSDQTHQCRDFLLQGSTIQQTWGKKKKKREKELYLVIHNKYTAFGNIPPLSCNFCTVSHSIISPGELADWALNTFPLHGGRSVAVCSLILWGCTGFLRGEWRIHRKFQGRCHSSMTYSMNIMYVLELFFLQMAFYREPSACVATLLRLLVYPRRSVEVHYIDQR